MKRPGLVIIKRRRGRIAMYSRPKVPVEQISEGVFLGDWQ